MNTRRSMKLPIIFVFIFLIVIVSFFSSIKQKEITCKKEVDYFSKIQLKEYIVSNIEGKKIKSMNIVKNISFMEKLSREEMDQIIEVIHCTHNYLGKKVKYTFGEDKIVIKINVSSNEVVLLDNIRFSEKKPVEIVVNTNTKSSDVLSLKVGDSYSEGEYMKRLKNRGYRCQ